MLEHALTYARRGWRVFPLFGPKDQCPADASPGKTPRITEWQKKATTSEHQVRKWWEMWPTSNIGLATGAEFVVLDIDGPHAELQLEAADCELPETLEVRTGKGRHLYLRGDRSIRNRTKLINGVPGVDIRGDGGYVVAPPSVHANGRVYEFSDPDTPLAPVPQWMRDMHDSKRSGAAEASSDAPILENSRNDTLASIAGSYRAKGLRFEEIDMLLQAVNQRRCFPPLEAEEVRKIAKSIARYKVEDLEIGGWNLDDLKAWGADDQVISVAAKANAAIKAALPDKGSDAVKLDLKRKWSMDSSREVEFVATITIGGQTCTIQKLRGRDILSYEAMVVHCFEQGMALPKMKRARWKELAVAALGARHDEQVTEEETVVGACVVCIVDWMNDLAVTVNWRDFPVGNETMKYDHGGGLFSVSARRLREVVYRQVRDAKRGDINEALRRLNAHRHTAPAGSPVMLRVRVDNDGAGGYGDGPHTAAQENAS